MHSDLSKSQNHQSPAFSSGLGLEIEEGRPRSSHAPRSTRCSRRGMGSRGREGRGGCGSLRVGEVVRRESLDPGLGYCGDVGAGAECAAGHGKRQRFAQTKSPRAKSSRNAELERRLAVDGAARIGLRRSSNVAVQGAHVERDKTTTAPQELHAPSPREHVPNSTRRQIVARDGPRCTFVSKDGCRCAATSLLQIHHERPWAPVASRARAIFGFCVRHTTPCSQSETLVGLT